MKGELVEVASLDNAENADWKRVDKVSLASGWIAEIRCCHDPALMLDIQTQRAAEISSD